MKLRIRSRIAILALLVLVCAFPVLSGAESAGGTLGGLPVPSGATSFDFGKTKVTSITKFAEELATYPTLTQVDMYESRVTEEQMQMLTDRFPNVRFGWTLRFAKWRLRTDATAFSTHNSTHSKGYSEDLFDIIRFCHDLQALDLGHNMVKDIHFLTNFKHLKVLILADNCVEDLSPLAELKELEYVEMFRNHITDLTPLGQLSELRDVNMCRNFNINDASALFACTKLERAWLSYCGISDAQQAEFRAAFPNAAFNFTVFSSTYGGWREHPRYFDVVKMFRTRVYQPWTVPGGA